MTAQQMEQIDCCVITPVITVVILVLGTAMCCCVSVKHTCLIKTALPEMGRFSTAEWAGKEMKSTLKMSESFNAAAECTRKV